MLPVKIAFVDLETSGSSASGDRIIEIGILRVEKNKLVKKFKSLVNPQTQISEFISDMTGINHQDLENAPTFRQIQDEVKELLDDAVFVAHNVRFDYGFIRGEFKRLGLTFASQNFCTVKLFRALHPELYHHNLDSLITYYNFECKNRHRAYDDAKVLWDFYRKVQKKYPMEIIEKHVETLLKKPALPISLTAQQLKNLPESPGVYVFYADNGSALFVGKSSNVKDQVMSRFENPKFTKNVKSMEAFGADSNLEAEILYAKLSKHKTRSQNTKIEPWPFKGPVVVYQKIIVNNWRIESQPLNLDVYKVLAKFIFNPSNQKYIKTFSNGEFLEESLSLSAPTEF